MTKRAHTREPASRREDGKAPLSRPTRLWTRFSEGLMFGRRGYPPFPQAPSAGEPLHEPEQLARARDALDLELSRDDRAVAEQAAEDRLLDLHRADLREPDGRRTTADEAMDDDELVARHEHMGAIP